MTQIRTVQADPKEAQELASIRVEAMRESLEAAGRFDEARARDRFLRGFVPEDTWVLMSGRARVGLYVLRRRADHLYLDHLYILPDAQGAGLGRSVITRLQADARKAGQPLRLMALKGSDANRFYLACGFRPVAEDALDITYEWSGGGAVL